MLTLTAIAALFMLQPQPADPAQKPPVRGRYTVIKITGDLDSDRLVTAFGAELDSAKDANLIVIELDGNRARLDVVSKLGARIKASPAPVSVLLKDSVDKKVGVGELLLGPYASACYIDPSTTIEETPAADIRFLAPADTSWESVERDVTGALWTRLGQRQADQTLSQVLLSGRNDWWVVPSEGEHPWRLAQQAPAGGQSGAQPHQFIWASSSGPTVRFDADSAIGLRVCDAKAPNMNPILADAHLMARSTRSNRTITSGLADAQAAASRILDDAKLAVRRIGNTLTVKGTQAHPATPDDYRAAGKSALDQIERASRELERVEKMLAAYPELERRPGTPAKKSPGPVRATVDSLRKELDKHKTAARDFQTR